MFKVGDKVKYIFHSDQVITKGKMYVVVGIVDSRPDQGRDALFLEVMGDKGYEIDKYSYKFEHMKVPTLPEELFRV